MLYLTYKNGRGTVRGNLLYLVWQDEHSLLQQKICSDVTYNHTMT